MNRTNWMHGLWALVFLFAFAAFGQWEAGAAFGVAFFVGREHAQRQYHLANGRSVAELKPWEGFDLWRWSRDSLGDLLTPMAFIAAALLIRAAV